MTGELLELSVALGERDPLLRLTLYSSEQTTLADAQSTSWRSSGCAARGWGYHGDHRPHGEALLGLRRRVPTVTTTIAAPEDGPRWFELLDALTPDRGLITAELVASSRR